MTLLVAVLFPLMSIVLAGAAVDAGEASLQRSRAQLAADAAALAAVAESGPHGRGAHARLAELYAERNGAELLACDCRAGAYEVQVTVAVGEAQATARAEIDPSLFGPAPTASSRGLHPELRAAVERLIAAARGSLHIVSGFRSAARQEELWSHALVRYGDPELADDWVARPGHSMHESGLAVDFGGDLALAVRLIEELDLPLYRPLDHEPWHFELVGSRG